MTITTADRLTRRLGQVFTPRAIADWMVQWTCSRCPRRVLDPAYGRGVFAEALAAHCRSSGIDTPWMQAYEIDPCLVAEERTRRRPKVRLVHDDFITAELTGRFDAVVANPPYVRHHELPYSEAVRREFDALCGESISRNINLYGLFLLKIASLLSPGGRAAVITPAEWLNADFGVAMKRILLRENVLEAIVHFDHAARVFEGVLTTAAITLLRRGRRAEDPVRLVSVDSAEALRRLKLEVRSGMLRSSLDPARKWTAICLGQVCRASNAKRLGDMARCMRGIATGANDYFTLRLSDLRRWRIDRRDVVPCVTRARQITRDRFTRRDFLSLSADDEPVYLLSPRSRLAASLRSYLREGETRGIDRRYLPSHRPVWYQPEVRPVAPILVGVFARERFRFVLNEAGAQNLTAYHGIYPHDPSPRRIKALFDYLNSRPAMASLRSNARIYADGLLKVEPRDVEAMAIPPHLAG